MKSPRVISDPEILGGTPVFIGTDRKSTRLNSSHPQHSFPTRRSSDLFSTANPWSKAMKSPRVISDPEILGGTPVFIGTRVPVRILFEHLEAGDSLEVFLEDFPSVSRELAIQVLEDAKTSLVVDAHPA